MWRSAENSAAADLSRRAYSSGGFGVVDGAGADDDEKTTVGKTENFEDLLTGVIDEVGCGIRDGALGFEGERRVHDIGGPDA